MLTYIFDFDGTLGDSMPFFAAEMQDILKQNHIAYSEDVLKTITPLGYKGTAEYFIEQFGLCFTVEALVSKMHENLYPVYRDEIVLKSGVSDVLHRLRSEGHSLYVLTASPHKMVSAVLKRCGVYDLFDQVWSCEDFAMTKGQPEIYRAAVARADGDIKNTVFLDDNLEAIRTAAKAGLYTIGVYDESSADYVEEIKEVADRFIYRFNEM